MEEDRRSGAILSRALRSERFAVQYLDQRDLALVYAHAHHVDLVVLALGCGAAERARLLREFRDQLPALAVIVLSEQSDLAVKLECFDLGAVDYLAKPVAISELVARVRVHLRRVVAAGTSLSAAGLSLDEHSREARLGDRTVNLSDREFRVLQQLLVHPGQVVSRSRLLSSIWGYDFDPHSNVVEVCVRRLRQRLGPDAPIETVRNAGYRIMVGRAEREALERAAHPDAVDSPTPASV